MKENKTIIAVVIAAAAYFLWKNFNASAYSRDFATNTGQGTYTQTEPVQIFVRDPSGNIGTTKIGSIQDGINIINSGNAIRQSATIAKVGYNSNVARLGDGSIKLVTVKKAETNSKGQTNFDKIIAKNKLLKR